MTAALVMGFLLPSCSPAPDGSNPQLERVRFRLDWSVNALHTPFFVADEKGYYRDAGLEVRWSEGATRSAMQPNKPYAFIEKAPWVLTQEILLESGHSNATRPVRAFYTNRFVE